MNAYEELEAITRNADVGYLDRQYFPSEPTAIVNTILTMHRAEVLRELEELARRCDGHLTWQELRRMAVEDTPAPAPVESAGDETGEAPHPAPCRYPASPYCCCTDEVAS